MVTALRRGMVQGPWGEEDSEDYAEGHPAMAFGCTVMMVAWATIIALCIWSSRWW